MPRPTLDDAVRILEDASEGYTVIDSVRGKGHRGVQDAMGLTNAFTNSMIIWYCTEEEFNRLKENIREFLEEVGGVCAVSEDMWLLH